MAENSKIEWTDHTFNPWVGCTKVSPGCDHCYAERRMDTRLHRVQWGAGAERQRTKTWGDPKRWNGQHEAFFAQHGRRQRVFCASLADVFDNAVPALWRVELLAIIGSCDRLDWLLLTKRVGNVKHMLYEAAELAHDRGMRATAEWIASWAAGNQPSNVWIGATVVSQAEADRDVPKLLAVPARVRFLSIEPMLRPIDLTLDSLACTPCPHCVDSGADPDTGAVEHCRRCEWTGKSDEWGIDWVICGGESGPGARPMHPDWARSLRDQCAAAGVPFLFKQWGEWLPVELPSDEECYADDGSEREFEGRIRVQRIDGYQDMAHVGKKAAGRLLDGVEHDGFPGPR